MESDKTKYIVSLVINRSFLRPGLTHNPSPIHTLGCRFYGTLLIFYWCCITTVCFNFWLTSSSFRGTLPKSLILLGTSLKTKWCQNLREFRRDFKTHVGSQDVIIISTRCNVLWKSSHGDSKTENVKTLCRCNKDFSNK